MKKKPAVLILGVICLLLSFTMAFCLNLSTMNGRDLTFPSVYGNDDVTMQGTYWGVEGADYAVLICPGYSCDRQKWRPFAGQLAVNGCSVMTFDYSGQGASSGVIGFDNAKTDNIPREIDDAVAVLQSLSGVDDAHTILLGHSMGGRAILRLLYDYNMPEAETTVSKRAIGKVILMSPEVNYHFNAQASLFAGTSDAEELPWKDYSAACVEGTNVYLYGSTADDIVADEDVAAIYARIGSENVPEGGCFEDVQVNEFGSKLTIGITGGVLHSYIMYSPKFAAFLKSALEDITGGEAVCPPSRMLLVYGSWGLGLLGLFLTLSAMNRGLHWQADDGVPMLISAGRFLRHKLLMWIPGTVAAFLLCCICVCMPFGSPVMNIPYMCFIAGYGLVMLFAYRKGSFKGTEGKLPHIFRRSEKADMKAVAAAILAAVGLCFIVWYVMRATMYRLIPANFRLFWVAFATLLMAAGYYVSGCESDMLDKAEASAAVRLAYNLIQYVPLFLLVAFYLVLKSYSGMIGQAQNMVLMYIFCVPLGDYLKKRTGSRLVGALTSAFLFQTLMITSAALISMF